ncbi:hypothetical protein TrLO_g4276 [Triparma laevis f. longispina]|uniref:Lectin n=1 Tax=Triparma laevis f. longispina TaxID=1714387 RepID=A0A9W6ZT72_9STRA|nr:hypothetical protein TrLO_g4276 [Triparma laevis f. longispina]
MIQNLTEDPTEDPSASTSNARNKPFHDHASPALAPPSPVTAPSRTPPRLRPPPLVSCLFLLVITTLFVVAKAGITKSGENQGTCYARDNCFGTGSADGTYSNNEHCTFTFSDSSDFAVGRFDTESTHDKLIVNGTQYSGTSGPIAGSVTAGQQHTWSSDNSVQKSGFEG